ncbi:MAG: hypothetical protein WC877_01610 [Dehalococcoidales bacterium]|jgi:hypothetical protein
MRLPVIAMGPPGCGKSYYLEQMSDPLVGILNNLQYNLKFEQEMSDAGLVGTVSENPNDPGHPLIKKGVAENHSESLVLIDEFSSVMLSALKSQTGVKAETLLSVLDSGRVVKALANGEYEYFTNLTLWCGIQPVKCDMSGGLGRRLCIVLNIPTKEDEERYADASQKSDNVKIDPEHMKDLNTRIKMWESTIKCIKHVEFSNEFYTFVRKKLCAKNYIIELYKKLGIGYTIAKYGGSENIVVNLDDNLRNILKLEEIWRRQVMQGPEIQQILAMIISQGIKTDAGITIQKVTLNFLGSDMGLSAEQVNKCLTDMKAYGYLVIKNNTVTLNPSVTEYYELLDKM